MKALFRLLVLCFFLLNLGLAWANPHVKEEWFSIKSDLTLKSVQPSKKGILPKGHCGDFLCFWPDISN
ncbi:hypothetical protein [Myroides sp. WP-1]|uniref:hypothetical protein n=1 Tax=Myroides sp. WP-1 TaxID=2759944 RepID=UPI0015FBDEC6|nr:hypothetical protein [Myroides sp. WP-1]MBB1138131.1 hypothetical protein [Myroides sp. WP-1]